MVRVQVATELGQFTLEVREDRAPASAGYFLADVRAGLYNGSSFFRIVTLANSGDATHAVYFPAGEVLDRRARETRCAALGKYAGAVDDRGVPPGDAVTWRQSTGFPLTP